MTTRTVALGKEKKSLFKEQVMQLLPDGGNLNACLTCGACSAGCPATGLDGLDPRKLLRMASLGMDEEIMQTQWTWYCTMCWRCIYVCPMQVDIPQLVFNLRKSRPRAQRPKGIRESCDMALRHDTCSAMGTSEEDWRFVVADVADEVRQSQPGFENMAVPMDRSGATYFLNQNSREPVTEPDEMVPLWKVLHLGGVDWTYGSKGWAAENYCMFIADDASWEKVVRTKAKAVDDLGCRYWLNTE
jgi:Na+-translocating ferredoxin:NAD+ oxidoreductase RnfC subunit